MNTSSKANRDKQQTIKATEHHEIEQCSQ